MAKITIHRALTELKTANERIINEIDSADFITVKKGKTDKINGLTIENYNKAAIGSYDKILALVDRYRRLKAAIIQSNAGIVVEIGFPVGVIEVGGQKMTVAEAIEYKNSIAYEERLLGAMKNQYYTARKKIENENQKLETRSDEYIKNMFGSEAKKLSADDVASHTKLFRECNEYSLVDPLSLVGKIEALEEKIFAFKTDVDAVLSEANATTFIDVD